ncbi:MAG TPA: hypothetical protein VJ951_14160 [Bacteroidales bacterium]|nr:hypothetical protein [Bacteroidales bacterium]
MSIKHRNFRKIEIITGIFITLSTIAFFLSFLLSFDFSMPEGTISDDIDFLLDNPGRLKLSGTLWLITGIINMFFIPVYLLFFHRFNIVMHLINSLLLTIVAFSFYSIGLLHFDIVRFALAGPDFSIDQDTYSMEILLRAIREIKFFLQSGIASYATFATIISSSKYKNLKFPLLTNVVNLFAGPVIVVLTLLDQANLIMTTALAAMWIGMTNIGMHLVNWGLKKDVTGEHED